MLQFDAFWISGAAWKWPTHRVLLSSIQGRVSLRQSCEKKQNLCCNILKPFIFNYPVRAVCIVWSSGWGKFWKEQQQVFLFRTIQARNIILDELLILLSSNHLLWYLVCTTKVEDKPIMCVWFEYYIEHGRPCLTTYPNIVKRAESTMCSEVFSTNFKMFGNVVSRCLEFLI